MRIGNCVLLACAAIVFLSFAGCANKTREQIGQASAQVQRLTEDLDRRTTDEGVYIRVDEKDINEVDPWGTRLQVVYSQGGVAETLVVRSAGPDREFHTADDIQTTAGTVNFKGVGAGIQKGVEKTAAGAAKGFVKGTVTGVKESIQDVLPRKRDKDAEEKPTE
jgi:hypothetical protein